MQSSVNLHTLRHIYIDRSTHTLYTTYHSVYWGINHPLPTLSKTPHPPPPLFYQALLKSAKYPPPSPF